MDNLKSSEIREIRRKTGLSQAKFSEKYEIPKRSIENWEEGTRSAPQYVLNLLRFRVEKETDVKMKGYDIMKKIVIKSEREVYCEGDYLDNTAEISDFQASCGDDEGVDFDEIAVEISEIQEEINNSDSEDKNIENWKFIYTEKHPENKKHSDCEYIEFNEFEETADSIQYTNLIGLDCENNDTFVFVFRNINDLEEIDIRKKTGFIE